MDDGNSSLDFPEDISRIESIIIIVVESKLLVVFQFWSKSHSFDDENLKLPSKSPIIKSKCLKLRKHETIRENSKKLNIQSRKN